MATDTKIVLKRSDVSTAVPNLNYVEFGELAFNYRDEKLYYRSYDVNGTTEIIKNYDFQRIIPVAKGGTGATTAAVARENLGAAPILSPAFIGTASLAAAAVQPTINISSIDADAQRALATVAYVRAEIADDAPTKTGGGATGMWGISVTGNAGTATRLANARTISQGTASDINFSYTFDGSGNVTPNLTINSARASNIRSAAGLVIGTDVQAYDADLKAIGDLTGTSGFLKKTAANFWALDTEVYTPTSRTITIATGNGIQGGGLTAQDLSANRAWTLGLTDTGVVANTYNDNATSVTPFTVDVKGRITGTGTPVTITPAFSSITGKPTTLSGYGIVDAIDVSATGQTKAGSLTASSFIRAGGLATEFLKADGSSDSTSYTPTARTLTVTTGNGITGGVTAVDLSANRAWTLGLTGQALNVHNLATDGFFVRSTSGGTTSVVSRSIAPLDSAEITITNGNGVSGNPTISLTTSNLTSLRGITTGGFLTRTAANTLTPRSIMVSGTGLSITNAAGIFGNPTITSNATSSNTASTLVARDASGAFSAGAITGSSFVVSGTVNTTLSGSATGTAKTLTLPNTTGTIAVLADIPDHSGGAATTIPAANGRVLSAIVVNALGHTTSVSSKELAAVDIPDLPASKITSGIFDALRISDAVVTGKVLTGLSNTSMSTIVPIAPTDTILGALGKLQRSINAKASTASPSFSGTVILSPGTSTVAPLRFVSGTNLSSPVTGAVEFDGTNLFITNSSSSRKTLAYTDSNVSSATTATTATSLATARTISQGAASDINFSYTFDGSANITPNLTINTSRASNIRSALGLEIGTNVQAYDADLAAIAALGDGPDADTFIDTGYLRKTGENTWIIDQETTPPNADENTTISGDVIGASALGSRDILNAVLATVNSSPGTYNNSATAITPFTVDGKGRVTSTGPSVTILPDWSSIANKPTTLSGYAITDAQALNSNLTSISTLGISGSNGALRRNADNSWSFDTTTYVPTSRTLTIAPAAGSGITVTPSSATDLSANRSWSLSLETGNLTQLRDLGTNTGIIVHNGTTGGGMITRFIEVSTGLQISNNNGVAGNPMISLAPSNLTSLFGLTTGGFLTRTASNTLTPRTITIAAGSTGLSITNGDGVSGNPTLTLSSTSTNTNNSLVARDASGNFSAGTITATLSGNASSASTAAVTATDTTNATYGIVFASGTSGGETLRADLTGLSFNPSTNTLTAGSYSGSATLSGTPTSTTAAADTNTTQIATTAFVIGQAASTTPVADGTATVGTSLRYARADHVHPTDTTRAPLASPTFTGTPAAPTAAAGTNTTQIATTAYVRGEITALIGGAPAALDTLNELAAALANDSSYASTITTALATKAPLASPNFSGTATAPTVSAGNYLVSGNSTIASGVAVQRVLSKTIPVGHVARLAEFTAAEGNVAIEIQVSSSTNGNSGTSTYRFQGGYLALQVSNPSTSTAALYRLYPFNDGRGHGEGTDTGLATTPWMIMIYQVQHVASTGGYGVAIVNSSSTVSRSVTVTITELRRGMSFTDKSADATAAFVAPDGNIYSHQNLLVGNRIGVGKVPTTALDVNGTITATTYSGGATLSGTPTSTTATADTNSTQIATTAFVVGQASSTTPTTNGTAAIGTSLKYARADHVHPTDTTRAPSASPTFTGTVSAANTVNIGLPDTDTSILNIGIGATGNRAAHTDYIGDTTYTDYGLRVGRLNDGLTSQIYHRGTGGLILNAIDAGYIAASTTNAERVRILANGNVGIGKTNPSTILDVNGTVTATAFSGPLTGAVTGTASGNIKQGGGTNQTTNVIYMGWSAASKLRVQVDTTDFGSTWPIDVNGNAASVTGGVYTSGDQTIGGNKSFSNNILIGTTTRRAIGDGFSPDQTIFNEGAGAGHYKTLVGVANRNDTVGATIILGKSRGTTVGSNTLVNNGDTLGEIRFAGADGNSIISAAKIEAKATGSPLSNKVPTSLIFSTSSNSGSPSSPMERMVIDSEGRVGIGTTTPTAQLDVSSNFATPTAFNVTGVFKHQMYYCNNILYNERWDATAPNETYDIPLTDIVGPNLFTPSASHIFEIKIAVQFARYIFSTGVWTYWQWGLQGDASINKVLNGNYIGFQVNRVASLAINTTYAVAAPGTLPTNAPPTDGWASIITTAATATAHGTAILRLRGHDIADPAGGMYTTGLGVSIRAMESL